MAALIAALAVALLAQQPPPPSAFAAAKARALLRDKLPCLGCHRLDEEGGRIGPDLSAVGSRLSGVEIYAVIANPEGTRPGTLMPRVPMSDATRRLVAGYLAALARGASLRPGPALLPPTPASLRPAATPGSAAVVMRPAPRAEDGPTLYARHCAACHGTRGRGDGDNARYLPVPPANHADGDAMAQRTDDRLFDAIAAGGAVLSRSPRMPPFGLTLTPGEIRSLVRYIRELCRCEAPAWSRDEAPR